MSDQPPRLPDLAQPQRLAMVAVLATLVVALMLCVRDDAGIAFSLGDTDDATRLVLMRGLLNGTSWYDQLMTRLQPPMGNWIHWSRLIDGGLALTDRLFRLTGANPAQAELMTRTAWPLFWIFPAVMATLLTAREMAGAWAREAGLASVTVLAAGVAVVLDLVLYVQFHPGRVDHHDVQIALCLLALAGAGSRGPGLRGAIMGGAAIGLGLAIGLEALLFEAAFAAAFALRFLLDGREGRRTVAFGLTLTGVAVLCFVAQTPPARWSVVACDALAWNLLAGTVVGGLGLAAAAWATAARSLPVRLGALVLAGGAALAVYLALDPHCTKGPFADVDPAIRSFWLDHVNEVRSWPKLFKASRSDAVRSAAFAGLGVVSWGAIAALDRRRLRDPAWLFTGLALALGIVAAWSAVRMDSYVEWFAIPPVAVLAAELAKRVPRYGWLGGVLAAAALSPVVLTGLILLIPGVMPPPKPAAKGPPTPADHCFNVASYGLLAQQPEGLVVSEIDLGPFVLAHTPSSAMSAPYHRMSWGILKARGVVVADADDRGPAGAWSAARALKTTYLLECPAHVRHADRDGLAANSLQKRLDAGRPPAWLTPLSAPGDSLQVYRVTQPAAGAAPPVRPRL